MYRISGVLTVISGWFLTALSASTLAALVAVAVLWGGEIMALVLGVGAVALLVRSNLKAQQEEATLRQSMQTNYDVTTIQRIVTDKTGEHLKQTVSLLSELIQNFLQDSETGLRQTKTSCNELFDTLSAERSIYYQMANTQYKANKNDFDARYCYYRIYTNMREVGRSLQSLAKLTTEHIANRHRIYTGDLRLHLEELSQLLIRMTDRPDGRGDLASLKQNAGLMIEHIDALQAELLRKIPEANLSVRGCELYLSFLLFAREFINHYEITAVLEEKLNLLPRNSSDQ